MRYIILLGIAIILLLIVINKNKRYEQDVSDIFEVDPDDVTAFTITKGSDSVILLRADTTWVFAEPDTGTVKEFRVKNFFSNVVQGKKTEYVTKDWEKYERYNVSDSLGTHIELKKGESLLASLIAGRSKSSASHDYIRYPDNPRVYMTRTKIMWYLGAQASFWR